MFTPIKNRLQAAVDKAFKEVADPVKELNRFQEQINSVVHVMDDEQVTRGLLDHLAAAFDVEWAALYLRHDGQMQLVHSRGDESGAREFAVPLRSAAQELGVLHIGKRRNGHEYSQRDIEAIERCTAAVSRAIALTRRRLP